MADYFCHQAQLQGKKCLNILTNGGAQRGHTVVHDGLRHVFHHFGSGTFSDTDTYACQHYILNPIVFVEEIKELNKLKFYPRLCVHPDCKFTTPYDMMFNKIVLENTGKHNSCGIGVWNTIERYEDKTQRKYTWGQYKCLSLSDNRQKESIKYLNHIRDYYKKRILNDGITLSKNWTDLFNSDGIIEHYISDLEYMSKNTYIIGNEKNFLKSYDTLVFENAQGLLLDQDYDKKNGTPSYTGSQYINEILSDVATEDDNIELCYVTRSYLTRHGDGDLPGECSKEDISPKINDITNVYNECQGHLRYAKLDINSLMDRIHKDADKVKYNHKVSLAVTHLDEYEIDIDADYKSYSPDTLKVIKT